MPFDNTNPLTHFLKIKRQRLNMFKQFFELLHFYFHWTGIFTRPGANRFLTHPLIRQERSIGPAEMILNDLEDFFRIIGRMEQLRVIL